MGPKLRSSIRSNVKLSGGRTIDRLSDEDTQILKLGKGAIRGHTCKVLVLERPANGELPTVEAIRDHMNARLDAAPRFRKRVVSTPLRVANPVWVDDPDFDIARHVTSATLDGAVNGDGLEQLVARLMPQRLDRSHPLWHLDVVERLAPDRMALIWRVHHCLADGTTCVRRAAALLWDEASAPGPGATPAWHPHSPPRAVSLVRSGLGEQLHARFARRPTEPPERSHHAGRFAAAFGRELRPRASITALAAAASTERTVAFVSAPLEDCRRAGKAVDGSVTVNDIVLAIIAGAIRNWLGPSKSIRVKVPVSLHRPDEGQVGNHNSFFFVDLPVAEADPAKRLLTIHRETAERKLHHDAETLYRLGTHPLIAHLAMSPRVFTFNVSNVHGPDNEVFVLGAPVKELYTLAEIAQHHALRLAVISSAGSLFFGLCADRAAVTDLQTLVDALQRATDELVQVAA